MRAFRRALCYQLLTPTMQTISLSQHRHSPRSGKTAISIIYQQDSSYLVHSLRGAPNKAIKPLLYCLS
ncbi:uncharacterized protein PHALS_14744 [Plasmopara halstedii]|uniref:Uncharacterized protein n=1 Tax=Plasmopara halstedii TaxID=4781 RepID=A0A0P1ARF2_PLAHL|nr:uncharacterized protein PHALS_14744 [Plasmopara halstedii]CEG43734.1 hypothetical protein PHALS_14744 [Plasmopara halstedii]|eukprot:XP_024580103.1 hypothetical protein PHALS_14744 [Plasmopara halstedii]